MDTENTEYEAVPFEPEENPFEGLTEHKTSSGRTFYTQPDFEGDAHIQVKLKDGTLAYGAVDVEELFNFAVEVLRAEMIDEIKDADPDEILDAFSALRVHR